MVFADLLKHQSISTICSRFVRSIGKKYNNKITVGEYIVERLISKDINVGFRYKDDEYTPFLKVVNKNRNFNVVFNDHKESAGYCALSYAKYTNNMGLIISSSTYGFTDVIKSLQDAHYNRIPLMLMSFYYPESESKLGQNFRHERRYIKENYTVNKADKFPNLLEYIMTIAELPQKGSVHLNICNNILDNIVNLEDIHLDTKLDENTRDTTQHVWYDKSVPVPKNISSTELLKDYKKEIPDSEDHSLLQYYEKHYEQIEENEKNEQRNK